MIFFNLILKVIYYTTLVLFINFIIFIFVYIISNKSIRNNLDILPIILPNECKVISSIYKGLLVTLALTTIKHGTVDATPIWCNMHEGAYVDGQFTGPVAAKVLCSEKGGISRFSLVGIVDNDNPFDLKENSNLSPASPLWCVISSLGGVSGAFNMAWGCEHQKMTSITQCNKLSAFLVALSSPIAGATCGSWSASN